MGTRESNYTCCNRIVLKWDNQRQRPVNPGPGVRYESGNWLVLCPLCGKTKVYGEFNPLSLT
jgi:hypothetical protein